MDILNSILGQIKVDPIEGPELNFKSLEQFKRFLAKHESPNDFTGARIYQGRRQYFVKKADTGDIVEITKNKRKSIPFTDYASLPIRKNVFWSDFNKKFDVRISIFGTQIQINGNWYVIPGGKDCTYNELADFIDSVRRNS